MFSSKISFVALLVGDEELLFVPAFALHFSQVDLEGLDRQRQLSSNMSSPKQERRAGKTSF